MSLRLSKSMQIFQTIREIPGIAQIPRSRREQRSANGPIYYRIVRRKTEQVFVLRILYAANLDFRSLT